MRCYTNVLTFVKPLQSIFSSHNGSRILLNIEKSFTLSRKKNWCKSSISFDHLLLFDNFGQFPSIYIFFVVKEFAFMDRWLQNFWLKTQVSRKENWSQAAPAPKFTLKWIFSVLWRLKSQRKLLFRVSVYKLHDVTRILERNMKARPCMFEYREDKIWFFQDSIAHEKEKIFLHICDVYISTSMIYYLEYFFHFVSL